MIKKESEKLLHICSNYHKNNYGLVFRLTVLKTDEAIEPVECLFVTAKLLQNEHFLYGTCLHNCRVWQQRAKNISTSL